MNEKNKTHKKLNKWTNTLVNDGDSKQWEYKVTPCLTTAQICCSQMKTQEAFTEVYGPPPLHHSGHQKPSRVA